MIDRLWNIWVPVHCRNLGWHDKRDDTNASSMTTGTLRSLMTEMSQLNRHIRCSTKNSFGVIVFHHINSQYMFLHFIPYACWNVTNHCWVSTKAVFVALELARNCLMTPSHNLNQCWHLISDICVIHLRAIDRLEPKLLSSYYPL